MAKVAVTPRVEYAFDVIGNSDDTKAFVVEMISAATPYGGTLLGQSPTEQGEYVRFAFPSQELFKCWLTSVKSLLK